MKFFDTHAHVNFAAFSADREDAINRALDSQTWVINVGTQSDTSKSAVELASKYQKGVYAAIGLHPVHTWQQMLDEEESHFKSRAEVFDRQIFEQMLSEKVVAVGECGLDYFRLPENQDKEIVISKQKTEFIKQIAFSKEHKLPLIVHCRDLPSPRLRQAGAYGDLLEILKADYAGFPAVIHSFTGNWETARKFLDLGFYIALNGILTFDKTGKLAEVVENMPFERLLTETDAPYLAPPPYRGKRNEPMYVKHVAEKIAEIKKISLEEAAQKTFENACSLFIKTSVKC